MWAMLNCPSFTFQCILSYFSVLHTGAIISYLDSLTLQRYFCTVVQIAVSVRECSLEFSISSILEMN
jgi:hypothetical protein